MSRSQIIGWIIIIAAIFVFVVIYLEGYKSTEKYNIPSMKDADGYEYNSVRIGGQIWMSENIRSTKSEDGTPVKYYNPNNDSANVKVYGRLYDWRTAQALCPRGWRMPSDNDWNILINYLGNHTGGRLKDSLHWNKPNTGANNYSRFAARPAGFGNVKDIDNMFLSQALFWTSTPADSNNVWCRTVQFDDDTIRRSKQNIKIALSLRCIKTK